MNNQKNWVGVLPLEAHHFMCSGISPPVNLNNGFQLIKEEDCQEIQRLKEIFGNDSPVYIYSPKIIIRIERSYLLEDEVSANRIYNLATLFACGLAISSGHRMTMRNVFISDHTQRFPSVFDGIHLNWYDRRFHPPKGYVGPDDFSFASSFTKTFEFMYEERDKNPRSDIYFRTISGLITLFQALRESLPHEKLLGFERAIEAFLPPGCDKENEFTKKLVSHVTGTDPLDSSEIVIKEIFQLRGNAVHHSWGARKISPGKASDRLSQAQELCKEMYRRFFALEKDIMKTHYRNVFDIKKLWKDRSIINSIIGNPIRLPLYCPICNEEALFSVNLATIPSFHIQCHNGCGEFLAGKDFIESKEPLTLHQIFKIQGYPCSEGWLTPQRNRILTSHDWETFRSFPKAIPGRGKS